MWVFDEDKLDDLLVDKPLGVLLEVEPLSAGILLLISIVIVVSVLDLRVVACPMVDLLQFVDAPDKLFEERTPQVLLRDLQLLQLTHLIGLLRLYNHHVVLVHLDNSAQDVLVQLFDLILRKIVQSVHYRTTYLLCQILCELPVCNLKYLRKCLQHFHR